MIKTFKCRETEKIWNGEVSKRCSIALQIATRRKLKILDNSASLTDLMIFPGNRLEALKGDRQGQYSIRVNQQYRLCFRIINGDFYHVELVDYH